MTSFMWKLSPQEAARHHLCVYLCARFGYIHICKYVCRLFAFRVWCVLLRISWRCLRWRAWQTRCVRADEMPDWGKTNEREWVLHYDSECWHTCSYTAVWIEFTKNTLCSINSKCTEFSNFGGKNRAFVACRVQCLKWGKFMFGKVTGCSPRGGMELCIWHWHVVRGQDVVLNLVLWAFRTFFSS